MSNGHDWDYAPTCYAPCPCHPAQAALARGWKVAGWCLLDADHEGDHDTHSCTFPQQEVTK